MKVQNFLLPAFFTFVIFFILAGLSLTGCQSPEKKQNRRQNYSPPPSQSTNSSPRTSPRSSRLPESIDPPRILVYIQGENADDVTSAVEEKLINGGFKLIDRNQLTNIKEVDAALAGNDKKKLLALKHRYGMDLILKGEVKWNFIQTREIYGNSQDFYRGRLSLKAVVTDQAYILFSRTKSTSSTSSFEPVVNLAKGLTQEVDQKVKKLWIARARQGQDTDLVVSNIIHEELVTLEKHLKDHPSISGLARRNFTSQTAFYNLKIKGKREDLEKILLQIPQLPMEIVRTTSNRVEAVLAVARLFGKNISGEKVLFVVDISGSMNSDRRIERAKGELKKVIKFMDKTTLFNLIVFSDGSQAWRDKKLYPPTEENKESARKFIDNVKAGGGTKTGRALQRAFEFSQVGAIYLLSDGAPKGMSPSEIIRMVTGLNQTRRVKIYTLGFKGAKREFMKELARKNGGDYKDIE